MPGTGHDRGVMEARQWLQAQTLRQDFKEMLGSTSTL